MSLELHDAHEFAWLTPPIRYTAAQDLLTCRPRGASPPVCCFRDAMYPEAYMSLELHDAHEFAWLTAPIRSTAAQD